MEIRIEIRPQLSNQASVVTADSAACTNWLSDANSAVFSGSADSLLPVDSRAGAATRIAASLRRPITTPTLAAATMFAVTSNGNQCPAAKTEKHPSARFRNDNHIILGRFSTFAGDQNIEIDKSVDQHTRLLGHIPPFPENGRHSLSQNVVDDLAADVGEAVTAALVFVGEP